MITLQKGRYEALELIGSGTTSRVEKARDNVIGRTVALKTFIRSFTDDLEEQFLREAQLVGQLSHPAIVQLFDVGIDEQGTPFLVMEYVAGKTLEQRLGPFALTVQRSCAWAADLANALALAHRAGIIHGDIKPGNIFVTPEEKVKLGDFGIARLATQVCGPDRVMGTPAYLSPEQILGEEQSPRSDQFSFGIVFYQMLTGVRPFEGNSVGAVCSEILNADPLPPSHHNPAVPPALDRVIERCLAKNPQDRFASFEEVARSLYPFSRSRQRSTDAPKKRSWWTQPAGHRDMWLAAAACLLLAATFQVPSLLRSRFGLPPGPARYYLPGVPYEAFSYTRQTVGPAAPGDDPFAELAAQVDDKKAPSKMIHSEKFAMTTLNGSGSLPATPAPKQTANLVRLADSRNRNN
ncbi:MAG TPA: serine/threonine-protein kinase [Candidatus Angelobacter sp.]|nr:serine/threonine-protein kinase [Candidatus Angelobacter sp.]